MIENLLAVAPAGTRPCFYRTSAGAELDLVLELPGRERWAVEIKRSTAPTVGKDFHIACEDIGATQQHVVHSGSESFPIARGVRATTLIDLQQALFALRGP
ncbi:MAG TPA: hypothetical protein VFR90_05085 [Methylibium sp.]|uniref:DUF4143 domain-containing protein n=1 Tax=Methylibium sp. TaxID=2067992 RepID=UPI002DB6BD3E|nr:hypothetical protein [Methylibium sp.]HEU4458476.1 hypothetical protein [Methylibium sp.]